MSATSKVFDLLVKEMFDSGFVPAPGSVERYQKQALRAIDSALLKGWMPQHVVKHPDLGDVTELQLVVLGELDKLDAKRYGLKKLNDVVDTMYDPPMTREDRKFLNEKAAARHNPPLMAAIARSLRSIPGLRVVELKSAKYNDRILVQRQEGAPRGMFPNFLMGFCGMLQKKGCGFTQYPTNGPQSLGFGHFADGYGHKLAVYWHFDKMVQKKPHELDTLVIAVR